MINCNEKQISFLKKVFFYAYKNWAIMNIYLGEKDEYILLGEGQAAEIYQKKDQGHSTIGT